VACRNAELGKLRAHKRQALLEAPAKELEKVRAMVKRGDLRGAGKIGVRTGRVVNKYKVAKHFELTIEDARFDFALREEEIAAEAALDGIYVIRTSLPKQEMSAPEAVRSYKALSEVERAFQRRVRGGRAAAGADPIKSHPSLTGAPAVTRSYRSKLAVHQARGAVRPDNEEPRHSRALLTHLPSTTVSSRRTVSPAPCP